MAKLLIDVSIFNIYQTVALIENNETIETLRVSMTDLLKHISTVLDTKDLAEIEFSGHKIYIDKVATDLLETLKTKYANRNVRIITNGEVFN